MKSYDGLTDYDVKHIISIKDNTDELLNYVSDLVLVYHNKGCDDGYAFGYDKGYEDGLAGGYSIGSYVHYSILDED